MIKFYNTEVVFEEIPDEVTLAVNITNCQNNCPGCHSSYLRSDIGHELDFKTIDELIAKNDGITCFCFMGEGNDKESLKKDILYIKENYENLKVGLYSGRENVETTLMEYLDYVKTGPYIAELGPLNKRTTNQRLYKREESLVGDDWVDITERFWK